MIKYTAATSAHCDTYGGCASGKPAVHRFEFKNLCPFHSPFDVTEAPAEAVTEAPRSTRRSRRNAQFDRMQAEIDSRPIVPITPEMESEYVRYLSDGLADTDGYFAPVDRQSFFCINF